MKRINPFRASFHLCNALCALALFTFGARARAATQVGGTIVNTNWQPTDSPFVVTNHIFVAGLSIEPGVEVLFAGDYVFEVGGVLRAVGTEQAPITFAGTNSAWQGIYFNNAPPGSKLVHCEISDSANSGVRLVMSAAPAFSHVTFLNNTSPKSGGGLSATMESGDLELVGCHFIGNTASDHAGGLFVHMSSGVLRMEHCFFLDNTANPDRSNGSFVGGGVFVIGDAEIRDSMFESNESVSRCSSGVDCSVLGRGGAAYFRDGNVLLLRTDFVSNRSRAINAGDCFFGGSSQAYGGGIYQHSGILDVRNCVLRDNLTTASSCGRSLRGGGLYVNSGTCSVLNTTIAYNQGSGVWNNSGTMGITNSILYFNEGTQVDGSVSVNFSDVQGGYPGDGNISFNPLFASRTDLVVVPGSFCIDGGNPDPVFNDRCFPPSQGTERNDMGITGGPDAAPCDIPNRPPVINPISAKDVALSSEVSFAIAATDPDDPLANLTYSLGFNGTPSPDGATIDPETGVFTWTPTNPTRTFWPFTVTVTDDGEPPLSTTQTFVLRLTGEVQIQASVVDNQMHVTLLLGTVGNTYVVEGSDDGGQTWTDLARIEVLQSDANFSFIDTTSVINPSRIYRVRVD